MVTSVPRPGTSPCAARELGVRSPDDATPSSIEPAELPILPAHRHAVVNSEPYFVGRYSQAFGAMEQRADAMTHEEKSS